MVRNIEGAAIHAQTLQFLPGLRLEVYDSKFPNRPPIAVAKTDKAGRFSFSFDYVELKKRFRGRQPELVFKAYLDDKLVNDIDTTDRWTPDRTEPIVVQVDLPEIAPSFANRPEFTCDLTKFRRQTPRQIQIDHPQYYQHLLSIAVDNLQDSIQCQLESNSKELRAAFDDIDLSLLVRQALPIRDYFKGMIGQQEIGEELRNEVDAALRQLELPDTILDQLQMDTPLTQHPLFAPRLRQGATYEIGLNAGLDTHLIEELIQQDRSLKTFSQSHLDELKEEGLLDDESAEQLGWNINLHNWADGNTDLIKLVKEQALDQSNQPIRHLKDLATAFPTRAAMVKLLKKTPLPSGEEPESKAERLLRPLEKLFPHTVFRAQHKAPRSNSIKRDIERLKPLVAESVTLFDRQVEEPSLEGIDEQHQKATLDAFNDLSRIANRYPGLDIHAVLNAPDSQPDEKVEEITRRIDLVTNFYALNQTKPFLTLNYMPGSEDLESLKFGDTAEDERSMVLTLARRQQAIWQVAQHDAEYTGLLLEAGYHSPTDIAEANEKTLNAKTGIPFNSIRMIRQDAQDFSRGMIANFGTILDEVKGGYDQIFVNNASEEVSEYLRRLPGYEDLFGSQAFCNCKHCQSIISPAAYFVDLMEFIETHITKLNFGSAQPDNKMSLWQRRRDLWSLELTCECTDRMVPYLTIINEILETYVYQETHPDSTLPGRTEVEGAVYNALSSPEFPSSFQQPFVLPLKKLDIYLSDFGVTRLEIVEAVLEGVEDTEEVGVQAELGVSKSEYELIGHPTTDTDSLIRLYGLEVSDGTIDVQLLLQAVPIDRRELSQLVATRFINPEDTVEILGDRDAQSVQKDIERINNLTAEVLDRMHRFVRLWKQLPWSISELDLVLWHMSEANLLQDDRDLDLPSLASLLSIQRKLDASVEDLCVFIHGIPTESVREGIHSLMDRLFNRPPYVPADRQADSNSVVWPLDPTMVSFLHPAFVDGDVPPETLEKQQRLLTGLNVDDETLVFLIKRLRIAEGHEPEGETDLVSETLSWLYRHARIARLLMLSVPEFFQLLSLVENLELSYLQTLSDLEALVDFYGWWKGTDYTLDELSFIIGMPTDASNARPSPQNLLESIRLQADDGQVLVFTDTIFAEVNGVTEAQSQEIVALNARGYTLAEDFDASSDQPVISSDVLDQLGLVDPDQLVAVIINRLNELQLTQPVAFLDDELVGIMNLSRDHSAAIMKGNPNIFEEVGPRILSIADANVFRLADDADLTTLSMGSVSNTLTSDTLAATLRDHLAAYQAPGAPTFSDAIFVGLGKLSLKDSRSIVAANPDVFDAVVDQSIYWVTSAFSSDMSVIIPSGIPLSPEAAKHHLDRFRPDAAVRAILADEFDISKEKLAAIIELGGLNSSDPDVTRSWTDFLQGRDDGASLLDLMLTIQRLSILFHDNKFTEEALALLIKHSAAAEGAAIIANQFRDPSLTEVRTAAWFGSFVDADIDLGLLNEALSGFDDESAPPSFETESLDAVAAVTNIDRSSISSLNRTINQAPPDVSSSAKAVDRALWALVKMQTNAQLAEQLDVNIDILQLITSDEYHRLDQAANAVAAAASRKYSKNSDNQTGTETLEDHMHEQKRSALTDYILRALTPDEIDPGQFKSSSDLYHWFLVDTELEGCARTSKIVAGISSLQLYVQRCLLKLEQNRDRTLSVRLDSEAVPQWTWRKNYRVWEANRKVFLWPENYIEPGLRDNKTPLFEELEKTLLQQEIDSQGVLRAYTHFLKGFEEVSKLKIAGSYHEFNDRRDTLYMFGATSDIPPVHFIRTIENIYHHQNNTSTGILWNPWRKLEVQIPVRNISPIIYRGRLYIFWVEIETRPKNSLLGGTTRFSGYEHRLNFKFSEQRTDNTWSTPQDIDFTDDRTGPVLIDLLADDDDLSDIENMIFGDRGYYTGLSDEIKGIFSATQNEGDDPYDRNSERSENFRRHFLNVIRNEIQDLAKSNSSLIENNDRVSVNLTIKGDKSSADILFPLFLSRMKTLLNPEYDPLPNRIHAEPLEGYTLAAEQWDKVFPDIDIEGRLILIGKDFSLNSTIDLYRRRAMDRNGNFGRIDSVDRLTPTNRRLQWAGGLGMVSYGYPEDLNRRHSYAEAVRISRETYGLSNLRGILRPFFEADLDVINGSLTDAVIDVGGDIFLLHSSPGSSNYILKRLGTTLAGQMSRIVFENGVESLFDVRTQESLVEHELPLTLLSASSSYNDDDYNELFNDAQRAVDRGIPDFQGPLGIYFQEVFFHVPFLIANHLNAQGKYAEAQRWYNYIFNPSFHEDLSDVTDAVRERRERDRVWQYIEFRDHTIKKLNEQLEDREAVELYARSPFNPHAIARLRLGAYKKTVVMKYIDNLLDWGDHLFSQDTMESINEAMLIYIMAADLLGERPQELGDCIEDRDSRSYLTLVKMMKQCGEPLYNLGAKDQHDLSVRNLDLGDELEQPLDTFVDSGHLEAAVTEVIGVGMVPGTETDRSHEHQSDNSPRLNPDLAGGVVDAGVVDVRRSDAPQIELDPRGIIVPFGTSLRRHACVFCIPENRDLKSYWDRIEDRLYKIRNCLNLDGIRRQLRLFEDEIDPRLLVAARATGMSFSDVLNNTSGRLPPYRFGILVAKAKEYAGACQSFGGAMLVALEKMDAEELARLRITHQRNILSFTTKLRDLEVEATEANLEALQRRLSTVMGRRDHYQNLVDSGLSGWEEAQIAFKIHGHAMKIPAAIISVVAAGAAIPPAIAGMSISTPPGSLKESAKAWANVFGALSEASMIASDLTGLQGGYERRGQGWRFSLDQAESELQETNQQIIVVKAKRDIAIRSRRLHDETIDQLNETAQFYEEKFSNRGLYTWLSTILQRLHRQSYQNAFQMARLAERAFRFERSDDTSTLLDSTYWDPQYAGLLAGEQLINDIRQMEHRYIETNHRCMEIDQAFSLTQIDPAALLQLKGTGECRFHIPERYFDLFYPGQFRRRIKSARLTIPCITGPYTNVSATLSLLGSWIRSDPLANRDTNADQANLTAVPPTRSVTIATSTAQNDAGVFRLDFRDERYMPFEGAGAINSEWHLSLPKTFKPFDYATINDVILHVSYTAEYDMQFRTHIEGENQILEDALSRVSMSRLFSLRQEFSSAFHQLLHSQAGTDVPLELTEKHFPLYLQGKPLKIEKAKLVLEIDLDRMNDRTDGQTALSITLTAIANNGQGELSGFEHDSEFAMPSQSILSDSGQSLFEAVHPPGETLPISLRVNDAGEFAPSTPNPSDPSDPSALDDAKLKDVYLYLEYVVAIDA